MSPDWLLGGSCCKQHDIDYDFQIGKVKADLKLSKCVSNIFLGIAVFIILTILGYPWYWKAGYEMRKWRN